LLLDYQPVQHVIVLNAVGDCNTVVGIIILQLYGTTDLHAVRRWPKRRYAPHDSAYVMEEVPFSRLCGRLYIFFHMFFCM